MVEFKLFNVSASLSINWLNNTLAVYVVPPLLPKSVEERISSCIFKGKTNNGHSNSVYTFLT